LQPVVITLEATLKKFLKAPDKSKYIESLAREFKEGGAQAVVVKETFYTERRSGSIPDQQVIGIGVIFSVEAAGAQVVQTLDTLMEEARAASREISITIGSTKAVDSEGRLLSDEELLRLIWAGSDAETPTRRTGLVYGSLVYSPWSKEAMPVVVTVRSPEILIGVREGRLRMLVPHIRANWYSCSVCGENLENCEHEVGSEYNGSTCSAIARDLQFLETSLTSATGARSNITDFLVVDAGGNMCEWYAFEKTDRLSRIKNINDAKRDGLITNRATEKFRGYFSTHSVGRCRFRVVNQRMKK
jgi:hypothetical protein